MSTDAIHNYQGNIAEKILRRIYPQRKKPEWRAEELEGTKKEPNHGQLNKPASP